MSRGAFTQALGRDLPDPLLTFAACALELGISGAAMSELTVGEVIRLLHIVRARRERLRPLEVVR